MPYLFILVLTGLGIAFISLFTVKNFKFGFSSKWFEADVGTTEGKEIEKKQEARNSPNLQTESAIQKKQSSKMSLIECRYCKQKVRIDRLKRHNRVCNKRVRSSNIDRDTPFGF